MDCYNNLNKETTEKIPFDDLCNKCTERKENGFELCRNCIREYIRICTCNKTFIIDKPSHYVYGKKNSVISIFSLPQPIPDFFYTHINGNLYHILGCRGCQHTEEISVNDNFKEALQASIVSCIYQYEESNESEESKESKHRYVYLSDSIDPDFEDYATKHGIQLGEPAKISMGKDDDAN